MEVDSGSEVLSKIAAGDPVEEYVLCSRLLISVYPTRLDANDLDQRHMADPLRRHHRAVGQGIICSTITELYIYANLG